MHTRLTHMHHRMQKFNIDTTDASHHQVLDNLKGAHLLMFVPELPTLLLHVTQHQVSLWPPGKLRRPLCERGQHASCP